MSVASPPLRRGPGTTRWHERIPPGTLAALTVLVVLLATAGRYGLHGDELYFRMLPLRWWYEDQPPLTVALTQLMTQLGEATWVQRVPAALAAAAGALLAGAFPRVQGYDRRVQSVAAWAHATTVYPLIMGHVLLTATLDLLAWQAVVLLVVAADRGRPRALLPAGILVGLACWNKLLILPLAGALVVSLLLVRRDLLRTRPALLGALAAALIGGPQLLAQALHGWPMRAVSADLVASSGDLNRLLVLPLLVVFVGPPLLLVWLRGLRWSAAGAGALGLLAPAMAVLVVFTLLGPAQPYYPVGLALCALALGWGPAREAGGRIWRRAPAVVAANAVVAALLVLPLVPLGSPAFTVVAAVNPTLRDQSSWPAYVDQVRRARGGDGVGVVTDGYALAGAIAHEGEGSSEPVPIASGHNALWKLGPPGTPEVLLVGERTTGLAGRFAHCTDAGTLEAAASDPFGVAGSPMLRCRGPIGGWDAVWPAFRHLGG